MKHLKMLCLAAAATALALALCATASATVLCKKNQTTNCSERYPAGTVLHATMTTGRTSIWEAIAGNPTMNTCPESTMKITTSNAGSATETVKGPVVSLTWSGSCTGPAATLKTGEAEIHHVTSGPSVVTTKSTEITIGGIFGESCVYGAGTGITLGSIAGGEPATLTINAILPRIAGGFACPAESRWTALYTFTAPKPLYISES